MSTELGERKISYKQLIEKVERYLYEYNVVTLVHELAYVLSEYKIYFNVEPHDIAISYIDHLFHGFIVTFVLKYGVSIKVKIKADRQNEYVEFVEVWYVTE